MHLIARAHHDHHEDSGFCEPLYDRLVTTERDDRDIDPGQAAVDVAAPKKRHQQVHRDRAVACALAQISYRLAKSGGGQQS